MFSVLVIRLRSLRLLRVSGIVMRLRMFLLLITFLKASHSFRNRLLVICKNAYLFATMIMTRRRFLNKWEAFKKVDRKSGSAGMPRPISYAVFCLQKKYPYSYFLYSLRHPSQSHSFPTRCSSDLSGIVMRLRMFLLLITFLKASHSFRNRLLVICKNAYLFATMIMTRRRFLNKWEAFKK